MPDNAFKKFICLRVKCKVVEIILSEEFLYGAVVQYTFICDPCSGYSVPEEDSPFTTLIGSIWKLIVLASNFNTMGSGKTLPGISFVPGVLVEFSLLLDSTFPIGKSLSGAKKLLVATGRGFSIQSQSVFMTDNLPPISSSWRQAP
jgi:hypothetical protein